MWRDHYQGDVLHFPDLFYDLGDYARWGVDPQGAREVPRGVPIAGLGNFESDLASVQYGTGIRGKTPKQQSRILEHLIMLGVVALSTRLRWGR